MRIGYITPLKAFDDGGVSGDRVIGRLIWNTLLEGGHHVSYITRFSSYAISHEAMVSKINNAHAIIEKFIKTNITCPYDAIICYHNYYKAPDYIGYQLASHYNIPYIVIEASYATKHNDGFYKQAQDYVAEAINGATYIIQLNPDDEQAIRNQRYNAPIVALKPFSDIHNITASNHGYDDIQHIKRDNHYIALSVAMMRHGDKEQSYYQLIDILEGQSHIIPVFIGEGNAMSNIMAYADKKNVTPHFLGGRNHDYCKSFYDEADLLLWPAHNEAFGMAIAEAVQCGLPVISSNRKGIAQFITHGDNGYLYDEGDIHAMRHYITSLATQHGYDDFMRIKQHAKQYACNYYNIVKQQFLCLVESVAP